MTKTTPSPQIWSTGKLLLFRFSFLFISLFILIKNNGAYPLFRFVSHPLTLLTQKITPWFSKNIIRYEYDYSIFTNGSGDTSYDWVGLLMIFYIAIIGSIVWSLIDKRKVYSSAYYWLMTAVRYYIAFMLINYGAIKLIHAQMPPPSLTRLMQPLGEFSPMGLAWTYLGFSKNYNIFMGIVEIMSVLLLFRKTMVLGACITLATAINIMTVNYFYDVPVKMVSTALFIFSVFLILPYIDSLYKFLIKGEPSQIIPIKQPNFRVKWVNKVFLVLKYSIITLFVGSQLFYLHKTQEFIHTYRKASPLYGIYKIEEHTSKFLPQDWTYLVFEYENTVHIRNKWYEPAWKDIKIDERESTLSIQNSTFTYEITDQGNIILKKETEGEQHSIRLTQQNSKETELIKRSFNWIQEYPYNR